MANALSAFWIGSLVDNYKKKQVMIWSGFATLIFFVLSFSIYITTDQMVFSTVSSPTLWVFGLMLLLGVMTGSVYQIAMPTLVTLLVPENIRDKANGMLGTVFGVSFAVTSVASGLVLGFGGMYWVLVIAIIFTIISILHLVLVPFKDEVVQTKSSTETKKLDIKGTIEMVKGIKGLFALIFLTTFNNLLGGVFMALMDAYGLTLVSVQTWGIIWGILSFAFIIGGFYIAKYGLGKNPLKRLFQIYIIIWTATIFFTIQPSLVLLISGALVWMIFVPFIEATEQTIIQKVVPVERQGRVFGFAHSVEQAASPLTAFLIGPIAEFVFIPFMTTGKGVELIGNWYGVGPGRGMALVFSAAGLIGLIVTLLARRAKSYKYLSDRYQS